MSKPLSANQSVASRAAALIAAILIVASCSSGSTAKSTADATADTTVGGSLPTSTPDTSTSLAPLTPPDAATSAAIDKSLAASKPGCDPLDTRQCALPFPSNALSRVEPASQTGRLVNFPVDSSLANKAGVAIDFTEWNRNDGFSPNSTLLTYVPGMDATASKLPPWTDLEASTKADATVVLIDTADGTHVPLWAELDAKAAADADRLLIVHPAVVLLEGHHYAVALRGMKDSAGLAIEPSAIFRAYRDRLASSLLENRRSAMEDTFTALNAANVSRGDLYLAWDFTVASERNISERMLSIRDQALTTLGDKAPTFKVTEVKTGTDDNIAKQIIGTYTVPNFLKNDGGPGNSFFYGPNENSASGLGNSLPVQNGTVEVGFLCNISVATVAASTPAHLVEYGHGLLGSGDEIDAGNVRSFANESNIVFCATKWAGMSEDDVGNAAATLASIGNFPTVADRLQQGVLNQIFLGRLMTRDGGLSTLADLKRANGNSMIDTAHLDYDGNSQGGIMGIMLAAVSPDIERATLGVTGINYGLLLPRSVDFTEYEAVFKPAYPNDLDRMVILDLLQMLWDRGEGGGYVQHLIAHPYANTPAKTVLFDIAFGDWQVSELSAMVAARTIGLTIHRPVAAAGRSREITPGWGLETTKYPSTGSAMTVWDSGSEPIPLDPRPPSIGRDPHSDPRRDANVRKQKAAFLFDDTLIDVCNGAACTAANGG